MVCLTVPLVNAQRQQKSLLSSAVLTPACISTMVTQHSVLRVLPVMQLLQMLGRGILADLLRKRREVMKNKLRKTEHCMK